MNVDITPQTLSGEVYAKPSKSYGHRLLICAFLSGKEVTVKNLSYSKDILATIGAIRSLGASVTLNGTTVTVKRQNIPKKAEVFANESGSTLRFLLPVSCALGVNATFTGSERLLSRPITQLVNSLNLGGAKIENFTVNAKIKSGVYEIDGSVSSQYITGLLFALSVVDGESEIVIKGNLSSADYVNITVDVLKQFGVKVERTLKGYKILGNSYCLHKTEFTVEGDYSNSAFMLVAGVLGDKITVKGLNENSLQGDKEIVKIIQKFGGKVEKTDSGITTYKSNLTGTEIDIDAIPDLAQIIAVLGAYAKGKTVIKNIERLRLKESDRALAIINMLNLSGIKAEIVGSDIVIYGGEPKGAVFDGGNDHRTVMSASILATFAKGNSTVLGSQAVEKSYPDFFEDFKNLGGKVNVHI